MEQINLYTKNGWLDVDSIMNLGFTYIFNVGQRGCGKTFGYIKWLIENKKKWIYLRRTEKEVNFQGDILLSSLIPNMKAMNIDYKIKSLAKGQIKQWVNAETEEEICLCCALSTFNGLRGADFSDYEYVLFDEFIKAPEQQKIKNEGDAVLQMYETINRNRELYDELTNPEPRKALKLICIGNAFDIANDVFMVFGMIEIAEKLAKNENQDELATKGNKLLIYNKFSPKAKEKEETEMYQEVSESIIELNLRNKFILNDFTYIKKIKNLKEYRCIFGVGLLYVYEHKSRNEYYICRSKSAIKEYYTDGYSDLDKMRRKRMRFWLHYLDGFIYFDSYESIALFEKYFDK